LDSLLQRISETPNEWWVGRSRIFSSKFSASFIDIGFQEISYDRWGDSRERLLWSHLEKKLIQGGIFNMNYRPALNSQEGWFSSVGSGHEFQCMLFGESDCLNSESRGSIQEQENSYRFYLALGALI
jgi:hypothetical protein